jgi:hypothetical protein
MKKTILFIAMMTATIASAKTNLHKPSDLRLDQINVCHLTDISNQGTYTMQLLETKKYGEVLSRPIIVSIQGNYFSFELSQQPLQKSALLNRTASRAFKFENFEALENLDYSKAIWAGADSLSTGEFVDENIDTSRIILNIGLGVHLGEVISPNPVQVQIVCEGNI